MPLMQRYLIAGSLLMAFAIVACGDSDEERVESVLRMYIDHYVDMQPTEMYALLDSDSQERCSEQSFVAFISAAREALADREFVITEVRNLIVDGDSASATVVSTVAGAQADPTQNTLVKEDGEWRLELPSGGC